MAPLVWQFLLLKSSVGFLHHLALPRCRSGVRSTTKHSFPWHIPTPPRSSEPGSLAQALLFGATHISSSYLFSSQGGWLQNHDLVFPFHLAKGHRATDLGLPGKRDPKGAGTYLHANHRVDEEQHGYEKRDVWERLEDRKHTAQRWPLALVPAQAQTDDPHEATWFSFPCYSERTPTARQDFLNLSPVR